MPQISERELERVPLRVHRFLERRSPGCSIVFYIDAEQAKVCNLHVAQRPLIKGVLLPPATRMLLATRRNPAAGHGRQLSSTPPIL
jgi:hypothetical protein